MLALFLFLLSLPVLKKLGAQFDAGGFAFGIEMFLEVSALLFCLRRRRIGFVDFGPAGLVEILFGLAIRPEQVVQFFLGHR